MRNGPSRLGRAGAANSQLGAWGLEQLRATARLPPGTLVPNRFALPETMTGARRMLLASWRACRLLNEKRPQYSVEVAGAAIPMRQVRGATMTGASLNEPSYFPFLSVLARRFTLAGLAALVVAGFSKFARGRRDVA